LHALKRKKPSLEVLVSVGGWSGSGGFSDMAVSAATRAKFIESVVGFVKKYQLDGLDIDWEYPGQAGAGNKFRPEDKGNFTLLLKELRARFDREGKALHRRLLLSIAAGASDHFLQETEMGEAQRYLDTVNLMSYDYYVPGWDKAGNHAPLFVDPADPRKVSADGSVKAFEAAGVPAKKLVLGVPFYGKVWGNVAAVNHGLFQPGEAVPNVYARYGDIAGLMQQGFVRYWDDAAGVPYLYSDEKRQFVSYEDSESLARKCAYVRGQGLAGVMFWEYFSDPTGDLLNAISRGLGGGSNAAKAVAR
jgi:chitinase